MIQHEIPTRDFGLHVFVFWPECGECFAPKSVFDPENHFPIDSDISVTFRIFAFFAPVATPTSEFSSKTARLK